LSGTSGLHPAHGDLLDIDEAATYLATTRRHMRRLVAERRIAHVKVGAFVRFHTADLDRYLEARHVEPVAGRW